MKIATCDVYEHLGKNLEEDVIFKGFTLVKAGETLTHPLAEKLFHISGEVPYLLLASSNSKQPIKLSQYTVDDLYDKVKTIMKNYSFDNLEDSEMVTEIIESTINGLSNDIELDIDIDDFFINEPDLYAHTLNTTILSSLLAIKSSVFQRWMVQQITLGALLHDIGYPNILRREGLSRISELNLNQIREHPIVGYKILEKNEYIPTGVKKIVLMHHYWEQPEYSMDSNGVQQSYPFAYDGKILPKESKTLPVSIVQVASTFEHMVNKSNANYVVKRKAIESILNNAEKIYGEGALLLANYISPYTIGDSVKLNNGKEASILKITSNPSRPIILSEGKEIDLRMKPFIRIVD